MDKSCALIFTKLINREKDNITKNERPWSFVFWFVILIVIDQLLKYVLFTHPLQSVYVQWGATALFGLQLFPNYNFAFSLPLPVTVMYSIYFVVLGAIAWYLYRNADKLARAQIFAWMLVAAGALSNVGERLINGYVKDYLYIYNGAIINLADLYIIVGVIMILWLDYRSKRF